MPDNLASRSPEPSAAQAAELLLQIGPRLQAVISRAIESLPGPDEEPLSFTQARALRCLIGEPRISADIAREMKITPASVSELLHGLERRGLVERGVAIIDRRRQPLRLTASGERAVTAAHLRAHDAVETALEGLPRADIARLVASLTGLRDGFQDTDVAADAQARHEADAR